MALSKLSTSFDANRDDHNYKIVENDANTLLTTFVGYFRINGTNIESCGIALII